MGGASDGGDLGLTRTVPGPPVDGDDPSTAVVGSWLGRYIVVGELGKGGMGVVYAAYDPRLDRKVAVKVLRKDRAGAGATQRFLREAQAMARVTHPGVITVYEVGELEDGVLVAMEYVDGGTLRGWMRERRRPWREVVEVFARAGRGLAAAHAAGLVHRDFKPDNVLVGKDGRVRVTDFGLVGTASQPSGDGADDVARSPISATLTSAGALLGTPAYMAPEQHERKSLDARADQFGFCVALWEALYGERPFAGDTYGELAANVAGRRLRATPAGVRVPPYVRAAVLRGLSLAPADRWPSMDELLEAISHDRRRNAYIALGVAGVIAIAAVAAWAGSHGLGEDRSSAAPACSGEDVLLHGAWDGDVRAAAQTALEGTGRSYAKETWRLVSTRLDAYAGEWARARREACEATWTRRVQSAADQELRDACLDRRRAQLVALTRQLVREPDVVIERAVQAADALPVIADCADVAALGAAPLPVDPAVRARVLEVRAALDEVRALRATGRYETALAAARPAADQAAALDHPPTLAEALALRADLERMAGDPAAAEKTYRIALGPAARAGDDELVATIWTNLMYTIGYQARRYEEGLALRPVIEVAIARAGDAPVLRAALINNVANLDDELGRRDEAEAAYLEALALQEKAQAPDDLKIAEQAANLGNHYVAVGRGADGAKHLERALAIEVRRLGPDHPEVAVTLSSLGIAYAVQNQWAEACPRFERSLKIREGALGPDAPAVGRSLNNAAECLLVEGRYADAEPLYRRALALAERNKSDEVAIAIAAANLGETLVGQSRCAEARPPLERSLGILEKAGAGIEGYVAFPLTALAACDVDEGRPRDALPRLARALKLREGSAAAAVDPSDLARTRFTLARALWASGPGQRKRAVELATAARDAWQAAARHDARTADQWLAAHPLK